MRVLVTGGCGFIGSNVAARHLEKKHKVTVMDNLSRRLTPKNLEWLKTLGTFEFVKADVRNAGTLGRIFKKTKYDAVYHLAGQVAVTTSVTDPRSDFEINARGTLNVLEAMRLSRSRGLLIYASTNKVYGEMLKAKIVEKETNVRYKNYPRGIEETFPLDFHSPYGCSKGSADQYVRDYCRLYGLRTVVFRQSCVYGERQFGVEDQGWVAHFMIQTHFGRPLKIYGDGKQVRDVLYIEDLLRAYDAAFRLKNKSSGQVFNIGGGAQNQISLIELVSLLEKRQGRKIPVRFFDERPGDQRIYVSDNRKLLRYLGWKVKTDFREGFEKLYSWILANEKMLLPQ